MSPDKNFGAIRNGSWLLSALFLSSVLCLSPFAAAVSIAEVGLNTTPDDTFIDDAIANNTLTDDISEASDLIQEDIPEEILRTEIITEARSPLTGEVLSAAEYAQLQAELSASAGTPLVSQELRYLIFLLQFRRGIKPLVPFL